MKRRSCGFYILLFLCVAVVAFIGLLLFPVGVNDIYVAIEEGDIYTVQNYAWDHWGPLDVTDDWGDTLLHTAAENGQVEITQFLLRYDEIEDIISNQNKGGFTPLDLAITNGHTECEKLLREAGAEESG